MKPFLLSAILLACSALAAAESTGGPYGVIVSNCNKYRDANIFNYRSADGGVGNTPSYLSPSTFQLTAGMIRAARWLGCDAFSAASTAQPFAPYCTLTAGQMRSIYDGAAGSGGVRRIEISSRTGILSYPSTRTTSSTRSTSMFRSSRLLGMVTSIRSS